MTEKEPIIKRASRSPAETIDLGEKIGHALQGGEVLGLIGTLGAGKTQLVKGIALGLGLDDDKKVTSPTFTLVQPYPGRLTLYHVDAYRMNSESEFLALGIEEMITATSACVVEWADRVQTALPSDTLWIRIDMMSTQARRFTLHAGSPSTLRCLEHFAQASRRFENPIL